MSSVFYGKCVEDVSAGQFGVFVLSCSALSCGMLYLAVYLYSKSEFCILPVNDQRDADMETPPALAVMNTRPRALMMLLISEGTFLDISCSHGPSAVAELLVLLAVNL